jgi:hypothetical protein
MAPVTAARVPHRDRHILWNFGGGDSAEGFAIDILDPPDDALRHF